MNHGRVLAGYCMLLLLLVSPVVPHAFAGTPGACGAAVSCPAGAYQCPTDGSVCQLAISRDNNGNAYVRAGGTPYTTICAKPGTPIQWVLSDATSFMDVRFANGATPFTQPSVYADTNINTVTLSIASNPANACYSFAIADCPLASGTNCGYADPKVVIYPPAIMKKHGGHREHAKP